MQENTNNSNLKSTQVFFAGQDSVWYDWLSIDQQKLVLQTHQMIDQFNKNQVVIQEDFDYSYLVFNMAKVYEGFLKIYLLKFELIDQEAFVDRRFRIGRSLNPDLGKKQQNELWLYDDLQKFCGEPVARKMWDTWLECRNKIFHYFPANPQTLSFTQALDKILQIQEIMQEAVSCQNGFK